MAKEYSYLKISADAKKVLDERLKKINAQDLKKIGVYNKKIHQIDFTSFILKNPIFISDTELKQLARRKWRGRIC